MLNIVVPMAGRGQRFVDAGYADPKPLIQVHGTPMIELVIRNLRPTRPHRFTFIVQEDHLHRYDLKRRLRAWCRGANVVALQEVSEGAACTVLEARDTIDSDAPLMIANSDQWVDVSIDDYLEAMDVSGLDGLIMTMTADDPKWSFVRFDAQGNPCEVVEKEAVSGEATVGIYNYRSGADFVAGADRMIRKNLRVNGEFYVAPVFNELIERGARIGTYSVGSVGQGMYGLGTPADLEAFLLHPVSRRASVKRQVDSGQGD